MTGHTWNVTTREAIAIQQKLREELRFDLDRLEPETVAGIDVTSLPGGTRLMAIIIVFEFRTMREIEECWIEVDTSFPYVPGLLSFREGPAVMSAFGKLKRCPDLIVVDGHGIAHPRRFGLASHLALLMNLPSIGCAKTCLVGKYEDPGLDVGCRTALIHKDQDIGRVVRTRAHVKPVFVSPGNRLSIDLAVRLTLACCRGRRLPEPTRRAHIRVNEIRRRSAVWWEV